MRLMNELRLWWHAALASLPGAIGKRLRARTWMAKAAEAGGTPFIEPGVAVGDFARLRFGNELSVGARCNFDNTTGDIHLGHRVAFNRNVTLGADFGRILIGDGTIVGPNVVMRAANHCFDLEDDRPVRDQGHHSGEIVIGKGAWISANVVILAGARIGDGAVIGAGAVVRGEIPAHSVAVGVPARMIRQRNGQA